MQSSTQSSDYCQECGYDGEIMINDEFEWECPVCHNKDQAKMNVTRRTCGYLGENFWKSGKNKRDQKQSDAFVGKGALERCIMRI